MQCSYLHAVECGYRLWIVRFDTFIFLIICGGVFHILYFIIKVYVILVQVMWLYLQARLIPQFLCSFCIWAVFVFLKHRRSAEQRVRGSICRVQARPPSRLEAAAAAAAWQPLLGQHCRWKWAIFCCNSEFPKNRIYSATGKCHRPSLLFMSSTIFTLFFL